MLNCRSAFLVVLLFASTIVSAQNPEMKWNAGVGLGFSTIVNDHDVLQLGNITTLSLERSIIKGLGVALSYQPGTAYYQANSMEQSTASNANYQLCYKQYGVATHVYADIFKGWRKKRNWTPYISVGVGVTEQTISGDFYNEDGIVYHYWEDGTIRDAPQEKNLNAEIIAHDGVYETEIGASKKTFANNSISEMWSIPLGVGFVQRIGDRLALGLDGQLTYLLDDGINFEEDWTVNLRNPNALDAIASVSLSASYNFGRRAKNFKYPPLQYNSSYNKEKDSESEALATYTDSINAAVMRGETVPTPQTKKAKNMFTDAEATIPVWESAKNDASSSASSSAEKKKKEKKRKARTDMPVWEPTTKVKTPTAPTTPKPSLAPPTPPTSSTPTQPTVSSTTVEKAVVESPKAAVDAATKNEMEAVNSNLKILNAEVSTLYSKTESHGARLAKVEEKLDIEGANYGTGSNELVVAELTSKVKVLERQLDSVMVLLRKRPTTVAATDRKSKAFNDQQTLTVLFRVNEHSINKQYHDQLDLMAIWIKDNKAKVLVKGYADKTGDADYNTKLSMERAEAVKDYLVAIGNVPPNFIRIEAVGSTGNAYFAKENKLNRRVEIKCIAQ